MAKIDDDYMKKFMEDHKEIFNEAKWCLIFSAVDELDSPGYIKNAMKNFLNVLRNGGVDPDLALKAIEALKVPEEETLKADISSEELTTFVDVLNKMRKKGDK